ncbi:Uu.00g108960.m01.CDS01 [Anthostomella pinea]|uniref:Uu.00g108960.m01.CDS01 n=1 Tax=Anthostomella pinea TaxID=933095 RepID=A0AAI8VFN3_9PEZI|nr:Uu.00g108960.m01.CDS01 [Anthostomella pinea]
MPAAADVDSKSALVPLCHIVTPVGMLGYGFNEDQTLAVLAPLVATKVPTALILDSGSTDSGPGKLALGEMSAPRSSYARDLSKLLKMVHAFKVPLIFSSAGGDGTDEHVKEMVKVIEEIAAEEGNEHYSLKTISIFSEIEKQVVQDRLQAGAITGCGACVPDLTTEDIADSPRIVGQMGPEPFLDAMNANPDFNIIVGGRAYDPSPYVGYASHISGIDLSNWASEKVRRQFGGYTHMGKIMECGGLCAQPKSHGAVASVYRNGTFDITPMDPQARCTPLSVAAHTLYEKSRPDILHGPGGYLDLNTAAYEQLQDDRTVRVRGSMFHFAQESGLPYQVKLEAAKVIGYRTITMGSFRDPILLGQIDELLRRVKQYAEEQHRGVPGTWELDFHRYGGPNGTAPLAPSGAPPSELFIIAEVLASTQDLATSVAAAAKIACTHGSYPGQKATSGNFAFGIGGKMTIPLGPCAEFSIYHLMDLKEGEERLALDCEAESAEQIGAKGNGVGTRRKMLFSQTVSNLGKGQRSSLPDEETISAPFPSKAIKSNKSSSTGHPNGTNSSQTPMQPTQFISSGTIGEVARIVRSKNAGPYEITFDIMFSSPEVFRTVKESGFLCQKTVASALGVPETDIVWSGFFDPALAFKATIPRVRAGRRVPGGSFMENDVHGSQQYLPLMYLKLPEELVV